MAYLVIALHECAYNKASDETGSTDHQDLHTYVICDLSAVGLASV